MLLFEEFPKGLLLLPERPKRLLLLLLVPLPPPRLNKSLVLLLPRLSSKKLFRFEELLPTDHIELPEDEELLRLSNALLDVPNRFYLDDE